MARQITDIRDFLKIARRKDAQRVVVLRKTVKPEKSSYYAVGGTVITKFKIRCPKCLYTMVIDDRAKAQKLESSLPPFLEKKSIPA